MLTELHNPMGNDALLNSSERYQELDHLTSDQMARIEEAMTMANVLLKLATMDASLTAYISAAQTTPELVERLVIAQSADKKELRLVNGLERSPERSDSAKEISTRVMGTAQVDSRVVEERRDESLSRTPKSRSSSQSSETSMSVDGKRRKTYKESSGRTRRSSPPAHSGSPRPRSKSPQIHELPRLGEELDRKPSRAKSIVEESHFNLRCWGAVFSGIALHWVKSSPRPVRAH